jgi:CBS domain-containing protein
MFRWPKSPPFCPKSGSVLPSWWRTARYRGIISERDVVRAVAKFGSEALRKLASDCMTTRVVTCGPEDTINDVMAKMTSGRFRHLPVIIDGKLGGIVSIGDIVKRRIEDVEREANQIREYIATA